VETWHREFHIIIRDLTAVYHDLVFSDAAFGGREVMRSEGWTCSQGGKMDNL